MSHLGEAQLKKLHEQLIQQRNIISQQLENRENNFGLSESLRDSIGESSLVDNHPADIGTEVFERGKDLALNEDAEKRLNSINIALAKLKDGHYGTCVACGAPIPYERLEALPATAYCIKHSPERSVSRQRPVEEPIMALDGDGEDIWGTVASWGTSSNIAFAEDASFDEIDENNEYIADIDGREGFVESYESFVATDLYGRNPTFVRNDEYKKYMENHEGEGLLEIDATVDE